MYYFKFYIINENNAAPTYELKQNHTKTKYMRNAPQQEAQTTQRKPLSYKPKCRHKKYLHDIR